MTDTDRYVDTLADRPFFDALEREKLRELVEVCRPRTLITGQAMWSAGEAGGTAYIMISGRVELSWRVQPDGQRQEQVTRPGQLIGLPHLIHEWTHESAAYPLDRTELLRLERSDFQALFDEQHPAAYRLVDAVAEELVEEVRDANRRMHEVFGHPAETLRMLRRRARHSERR